MSSLFCDNIISSFFEQFRLVIKYSKLKVFYFSRATKNTEISPFNLQLLKEPLLWLKDILKYLSFIFNKKLSFHQHICLYTNKVLFTIKNMKMLSNLYRELLLTYKQVLYRTCIMPIVLYSFQL